MAIQIQHSDKTVSGVEKKSNQTNRIDVITDSYKDSDDSITNHVILVNTDPCNDVDDDVACGWLLKVLLTQLAEATFHVIFVVQTYDTHCPLTKKSGRERLVDALVAFNGEDIVNELLANNSDHSGTSTGRRIEVLPPHLLPLSYKVTLLLNIAPNLDDIVCIEHLNYLRAVSHQGMLNKRTLYVVAAQ